MSKAKPAHAKSNNPIPQGGSGGGWGAKILRACGFYGPVKQEFCTLKSILHSSQIPIVVPKIKIFKSPYGQEYRFLQPCDPIGGIFL